MKRTNNILISIIVLTFFACNNSQTENRIISAEALNLDVTRVTKKKITADTLYKLLDNSLQPDTFEFINWDPFLFLRTGYFLSTSDKNSMLISCPTDSTYKIELYSKLNNNWVKNDELKVADAFPVQFFLAFSDYNFDGQKDVYLQCSVSNGYALSHGHLLTINPKTKKLQIHPEASDLANMQPDFKSKTIISEEVDWSVDYGFQGVCDLKNKWINGKLKTIKRECPSKNPKGYQ